SIEQVKTPLISDQPKRGRRLTYHLLLWHSTGLVLRQHDEFLLSHCAQFQRCSCEALKPWPRIGPAEDSIALLPDCPARSAPRKLAVC
ncbi:hypothetical protein WG66_016128, partial [Moniliophthora roreri]